jgi:His/Glu/Gln/Arg/opine family amino acid ABC transporter permease subunit
MTGESSHWGTVWHTFPSLLSGLWLGVYVAVLGIVLATVVGLLVAMARLSKYRPLRVFAFSYTQFFRGVALYVLIVWVYYGLAVAADITLGLVITGVLCIALLNSAYLAEVFRAGMLAVDKGQLEAAKALGLSPVRAFRHVIGPQAARISIPATGNYFVDALKESSVLSVIGMRELTSRTQEYAGFYSLPFEFYGVATVLYLIVTIGISQCFRMLERRMNAHIEPSRRVIYRSKFSGILRGRELDSVSQG